jgi:hypothetical protein
LFIFLFEFVSSSFLSSVPHVATQLAKLFVLFLTLRNRSALR